MRLTDREINSIVSLLQGINSKLCDIKINTANLIGETTGIPTWDPTDPNQNQAEIAFDNATGIWYYWDGDSWETLIAVEQGLSMGSPIKLGDDSEGITGGILTSERFINHNGFPITHAANDRVAANSSAFELVRKILDLQVGSTNSWNESVSTNDNAGSSTNNFIYNRGFNLSAAGTRIDNTKIAWGESWEFHYEPTAGDIFVEKHIIFIGLDDVQHRLESYTIDISDLTAFDLYNTISNYHFKNPSDDNDFFILAVNSTTGATLKLLGSASGKGIQIIADASSTNAQIIPDGYTGTAKELSMSSWNGIQLPALRSAFNGVSYSNIVTKAINPLTDNDCEIGNYGARYSALESTGVRISKAADTFSETLKITSDGKIFTANIPVYADEAAATAGGLSTNQWYRTATGELRIKL